MSGLAGVAASQLLTSVLNIRATPVQAVAEVIVVGTPGSLAESLISLVGRNDKPILVAGVTLGIIGLGAVAGLLAGRRRVLGHLVFFAMAAIALAAILNRSDFGQLTLLPLLAGVVVWSLGLDFLLGAARAGTRAESSSSVDAYELSRRGFVLKAGGVAVAALAVGAGSRLFGQARSSVEYSRRLLKLPVSEGTLPTGVEVDATALASWRTPNASFYRIDTALVVPTIDLNAYQLRIHGMVDREITLTYRDLARRTMTESWTTICCVSNPLGGSLIGNAWWSGVRVAELLAEAGVQPGANAVLQTSQDGWNCGTPLSALTDDRNAVLALAMNGQPLPVEHGFPVRMIVPGLYGYVSATKWVVDLEVTTYDRFSAYWTQRGWSAKGPVKTESRIESPVDGGATGTGAIRVGGHAWAQHTGIEKVEVRLDGQAWQPAELGRVPSDDTWVQWTADLTVDSGAHILAVRATDRSGYTQTPVRADVVPDGATGWHTVGFNAV